MKTKLTIDEIYNLSLDSIIEEMDTGCFNPLAELAALRHQAHIGRLDNTDMVNQCLADLNIGISIDDVDDVHEIINPILVAIEKRYNLDGLASHGIAAMNAYGS